MNMPSLPLSHKTFDALLKIAEETGLVEYTRKQFPDAPEREVQRIAATKAVGFLLLALRNIDTGQV